MAWPRAEQRAASPGSSARPRRGVARGLAGVPWSPARLQIGSRGVRLGSRSGPAESGSGSADPSPPRLTRDAGSRGRPRAAPRDESATGSRDHGARRSGRRRSGRGVDSESRSCGESGLTQSRGRAARIATGQPDPTARSARPRSRRPRPIRGRVRPVGPAALRRPAGLPGRCSHPGPPPGRRRPRSVTGPS